MADYYLIIIPIAALLITQALKLAFDGISNNFTWHHLTHDYGGMPSSHSAFVAAIATEIALTQPYGIKSPLSAVCLLFAILIIHDAKGLRNYLGKANHEINKLSNYEIKLKEKLGHTTAEVIAGCLLGILIAAIGVFLV